MKYDVPSMLKLAQKIHEMRVIPSCMTCNNFEEETEHCRLFQQRPPARVIAYGCEYWDDLEAF